MEVTLKNNTFNEMVNYILRLYPGEINRSNASKIAARHLGENMLLLDATLQDEADQFIETPESKTQKFKKRDFISGAIKTYEEWEEEQRGIKEPPKQLPIGGGDGGDGGSPGGDGGDGGEWKDPEDYGKLLDDLVNHLYELITSRDPDLEAYYEASYNLIQYIIEESRRQNGDEYTWKRLNSIFPGLKQDLTSLVYAISNGTFNVWSQGKDSYMSAIHQLEEGLGVDGSPMYF